MLLQRRTDFSVPVHMHSFSDHGGLRDLRRPLAGLTLLPTFFNAVCWQVAHRAGKKPGEVAAPAVLPRCHGWACGSLAT